MGDCTSCVVNCSVATSTYRLHNQRGVALCRPDQRCVWPVALCFWRFGHVSLRSDYAQLPRRAGRPPMARFAGRGLCHLDGIAGRRYCLNGPIESGMNDQYRGRSFLRGMGYADLGETGWPVTGALSFASLQHRTISQ
jgi:hypothetical protein